MCVDSRTKGRWLHTQALTLRHTSQEASIRKAVMCPNVASPHLRRVLFVIMSMTLIRANTANPVFCFMDKKRAEGKHFLRLYCRRLRQISAIYYAKVKEYLNALEETA